MTSKIVKAYFDRLKREPKPNPKELKEAERVIKVIREFLKPLKQGIK